MKTEKIINPYFKIEVTRSFFGFPISKIPKLTITNEIPSSARQIRIKGTIRASKLQYLIIKTSTKKIDSIVATSIATENAETPMLSALPLLSIRWVKKMINKAQIILRIIYIILVTYLGNHHCNVIMKLFIAVVFPDQIYNIINHLLRLF